MQTLAQCWERFRDSVVPPGSPPIEVDRAKMCFYAGAAYMFDQNLAVGERDVPELVGAAHLKAIGDELKEYARVLQAAQTAADSRN